MYMYIERERDRYIERCKCDCELYSSLAWAKTRAKLLNYTGPTPSLLISPHPMLLNIVFDN